MVGVIRNIDEAFSEEERRALLDTGFPLLARMDELNKLLESATPDSPLRQTIQGERKQINERIWQIYDRYQKGLPVVEFSRCPFTKEPFAHSLDIYGVDGFWWSRDQAIRRDDEPLGGGFYALCGAVRAPSDHPPNAPFFCRPGPEKPYVISRLLEKPSIKAVVSHVTVGGLDAYPVVYFSSESLPVERRSNEWALNIYRFWDPAVGSGTGEFFDAESSFDYRLAPWVERGKLLWIAPEDASQQLRDTTVGCPYLKLDGKQAVWRLEEGELWWGPEVPA